MTYKTSGIVLKLVKYGDTSLIATIYTQLFGLQTYMVKGARQQKAKSTSRSNYFQLAAILDLEVYHHPLKQMQLIKELRWQYLYNHIFFNIVRNAIAMYMVELLQITIQQEESNPEFYTFLEQQFTLLDTCDEGEAANVPILFTLKLLGHLGFHPQGKYDPESSPILDLKEGVFTHLAPNHPYSIKDELAYCISVLIHEDTNAKDALKLNQEMRRTLLGILQTYMQLHLPNFKIIKTLNVLKSVLD